MKRSHLPTLCFKHIKKDRRMQLVFNGNDGDYTILIRNSKHKIIQMYKRLYMIGNYLEVTQ